ncbi:MAG: hypothetical protein N2376_00290 [Clostridia bacterium]|nr:hypothetical protein [Clostridia bacterium]
MKKFVIVMISFLVLFVFLMLNYLLWDKENLLKQRDSDKIEQDWLRGQNRTLQTTVNEQEQSIKTLQDQNDAQRSRISELEQQVRLALQRETRNQDDIRDKNEAIALYKTYSAPILQDILSQWMGDISKGKLEESMAFLDKNAALWGKLYDKDPYLQYLSSVQNIAFKEETKDDSQKAFTIIADQGDDLVVKAQAIVNVNINQDKQKDFKDLAAGQNTIEVVFQYNTETAKWVIVSVSTLENGKP